MKYETTIGLEIHVQLKTKSKMFCSCDNNAEGKAPNSVVCPVCMGFPGVLPVVNKTALDWAIKTALALNCQINPEFRFDRKHYFYPDLPKNYQISQYDLPLSKNGFLEIWQGQNNLRIGIRRVHLEEDTAKLLHTAEAMNNKPGYSLVDFNRAGIPLMEIVTEPDIHSAQAAKIFLQELRNILRFLAVSDADMEKGQLRCDANISLMQKSKIKNQKLGIPVEIKNMNSFKMVEKALTYEEKRQREILESGEKVAKETRGWVDDRGITVSQRTKEFAHDYRYFPEPDLAPFRLDIGDIKKIKNQIPELPPEKRQKFEKVLGLPASLAQIISANQKLAAIFEEVIQTGIKAQVVANWLVHEKIGTALDAVRLSEFLKLLESGKISGKMGKEIVKKMIQTGKSAVDILQTEGLKLVEDKKKIEKIIDEVIKENSKAVADFRAGKESAFGFLVGQVMAKTKGQANPKTVNEILRKKLVK